MALWIDDGTGLHKAFLGRVDNRAPAFLCCPGPSLKKVRNDLRGPGRAIYAINSAYPKIKPDMWFGLDRTQCHHPRVWFEAFPKVTRFLKGDTGELCHCPNVYYADMDDGPLAEMFFKRAPDTNFLWEHSTFLFALHFLYWLGHKQVYFVGCDMGGPTDYYDDRQLPDGLRESNGRLHDRQVELLRRLAPVAARNGLRWVSCTPGSRLNDFLPFVPVSDAIAQCTAGMPDTRPLLHSSEADALADGRKSEKAQPSRLWAAEAQDALLKDFEFSSVLDVGSGRGLPHTRRFIEAGKHVTAVDHQSPPDLIEGVQFVQSDFTNDECAVWKRKYDCVWCSHVLEHQRNPGLLIDRMLSSLKPGGILAVTVPPASHALLGGHVSIWNMGLLCYHLVSAGMDLRGATLIESDGNISVIARKKMFNRGRLGLHLDKGDIEKLSPYFPVPVRQGFDGRSLAQQATSVLR